MTSQLADIALRLSHLMFYQQPILSVLRWLPSNHHHLSTLFFHFSICVCVSVCVCVCLCACDL